jgi:flagellin
MPAGRALGKPSAWLREGGTEASRSIKEGDMIINHNMSAMYANRVLGNRGQDLAKDIEKLSSGQKINRGGDDASGLAVSEKMRSQIRGLNQAGRNIENAVSFIQTTEGYLSETQDILHRMQIQVEVSQLVDEVNRIASHAQFNGMNMLTGRFANPTSGGLDQFQMYFQVGANMDQRKRAFIGTMTAEALKLVNPQGAQGEMVSISTPDRANQTIGVVDEALRTVSKQRADLGAYQNRFEMAAKGVAVAAENMQAAESRIRDTDMAAQMVDYVKNQILSQAGSAMLAHANVSNQSVLQLLG